MAKNLEGRLFSPFFAKKQVKFQNGDLKETADFFINAAENYKTWVMSLGINGSDLMKNSYNLLFDQDFKLANQEGRLKAIYGVVNKLDSYYNVCKE